MNQPLPPPLPIGSPPIASSSRFSWAWILLGISGIFLVLCCGGGFWFVSWGLSLVADEVGELVACNPEVVAEVGSVESFRMDILGSALDDDDDVWHYRIEGSKARGTMTIRHVTTDDGSEAIQSIRFRRSDGRVIDIPVEGDSQESP